MNENDDTNADDVDQSLFIIIIAVVTTQRQTCDGNVAKERNITFTVQYSSPPTHSLLIINKHMIKCGVVGCE